MMIASEKYYLNILCIDIYSIDIVSRYTYIEIKKKCYVKEMLYLVLKKYVQITWLIVNFGKLKLDFVFNVIVNYRRLVVGKGSSSDILCDLGSIIGSKARSNSYGCISTLPTSLVGIIHSC